MGWDAYAEPVERVYRWQGAARDGIKDPAQDLAFRRAADAVEEIAGTVDGFLSQGGLDCSACGRALEEATGENARPDGERGGKYDWSPRQVAKLATSALWDNVRQEEWAKQSAKAFLETAARLGLRVRFSW